MSEILLNKFEKEKRVIELHQDGNTIREISKIVKMSFRDIGKKIKEYDRKIELQTNRQNNNNTLDRQELNILYEFGTMMFFNSLLS